MTDDELKSLFETMRQEMTAMRQETADRFDAMRQENGAMRQETADRFDAMRQETSDRFDAMRQETSDRFDAIHLENAAAHAETRRQFGASQEHLEGRIELLAETVQLLDANQRATARTLDEKIDRLVAETQGLVRFAYDNLNGRVLVLEGKQPTRN
ncbi:MAG TPA: hypothetical protein VN380_06710 [Thermoanaerobaculia bacterium]|nr:hypothetical protein [Thermoanaerobaculia bacterium]